MAKKGSDSFTERARAKIQENLEREERNRQITMFRQRMEVARAGVMYYQHGKYQQALENYYKYLGILERFKGVKSGALEPKDFDSKKDVAELLLLSGIFWDIAKLQDRSKKKDRNALKTNLEKFVIFSKGMPYQHMCAELVRKYLMNEKAVNRAMFKDVQLRLGGGKCFIATSVEDYCERDTLTFLRSFRDRYLLKRNWGKAFVSFYYCVGPIAARLVLRTPERVQKQVAVRLDHVSKYLVKLK